MKNLIYLFSLSIMFIACTNSPEEHSHLSIQTFMKVNVSSKNNYTPLSFSKIDTLAEAETLTNNKISFYRINHVYEVLNSKNEKIEKTVAFFLDENLKVVGAETENLTEETTVE